MNRLECFDLLIELLLFSQVEANWSLCVVISLFGRINRLMVAFSELSLDNFVLAIKLLRADFLWTDRFPILIMHMLAIPRAPWHHFDHIFGHSRSMLNYFLTPSRLTDITNSCSFLGRGIMIVCRSCCSRFAFFFCLVIFDGGVWWLTATNVGGARVNLDAWLLFLYLRGLLILLIFCSAAKEGLLLETAFDVGATRFRKLSNSRAYLSFGSVSGDNLRELPAVFG